MPTQGVVSSITFGVHSFGCSGPIDNPSPRAKSMNGILSGPPVSSPWPSVVRQNPLNAWANPFTRAGAGIGTSAWYSPALKYDACDPAPAYTTGCPSSS